MTKKQLAHYLKGGKFLAIYHPQNTLTLRGVNYKFIDEELLVYQNSRTFPLTTEPYKGDHLFNSSDIFGSIPESDFAKIKIIDAYLDNVQPLPKYAYRLIYDREGQLEQNFGINHGLKLPLEVVRVYDEPQDQYILSLSKPQATRIDKCVWEGKKIKWETLLGQKSLEEEEQK